MFPLAVLIGIYSYLIFGLGALGLLYKQAILIATFVYIFFIAFYFKSKISEFKKVISKIKFNKIVTYKFIVGTVKKNKLSTFLLLILFLQVFVNFIGVLGPEISFDSLWYHLTLPKIYILNNAITHIPGGLLYYSDMPKFIEMLYIPTLMFGNETFAKSISFLFGILLILSIYKLSRKYLPKELSLLASIVFYSSIVVGWVTITSYVDLGRTFFELMAFWIILNWFEKRETKLLINSAIMSGMAIAVKLISLCSIFIFLLMFVYDSYQRGEGKAKLIKNFSIFCFISILIPLPWFIFAFINTGNPLYPYFSLPVDSGTPVVFPNPLLFFDSMHKLFLRLNDPISPIYLISLPLIVLILKKISKKEKIFLIYSFLAIIIWYLTQQARGGRFILPYLPVFSILVMFSINRLKNNFIKSFMVFIICIVAVSSIFYRGIANKKFVPVILGKETKTEFLKNNLNFTYGDFYDTDGYFKKNIKSSDKVLLYGFHNLFYIDFPYVDSSWIKKGDKFNYIATQNSNFPPRFLKWNKVYYNNFTKVGLYSDRGKTWVY